MKALVTGGTGFLGKFLCIRLKELGFHVTALGRNENACDELTRNNFSVVRADLNDEMKVVAACAGQDYIFHCAALSSPWGRYSDFYTSNVIGTRNILKGSMEHNVSRFIHVSTPSIYFNYTNRLNVSEDDPLPRHQANSYAKTKLLAEHEVNLAQTAGLNTIIIRPRGIFGPNDTAIIPRLLKTHDVMPLPLFRQGKVMVDMTYVENVVEALIACIHASNSACGMKFNITNDEPIYLIDLLSMLFRKMDLQLKTRRVNYRLASYSAWLLENLYKLPGINKEPPFTRYTLGLLAYDQTLDITKAKQFLSYKPKYDINEGLDRYIESLQPRGKS